MSTSAGPAETLPRTPAVSGSAPPRIVVLIPAFNEEGNVDRLVAELAAEDDTLEAVVIDDGSTDDTARVATRAGARVIRLPFNCGIGATVQAGLRHATSSGCDRVIRLDGDGQHDPLAIRELASTMSETDADFVLGSRFLDGEGYQSTFARRLGARWFSLLLRMACGLRITDPTSGLWMANRRAAAVLAEEYSSDYPEVDSLVRLQRSHCKIAECSVRMRPRLSGRSSIGMLSALYYMVKVTIALLIGRTQPPTTGR